MHSICYVIIPKQVEDIEKYGKEVLAPYNSKLDVLPYKVYKSKEETLEHRKRCHCATWEEYSDYLKLHEPDTGIENGCYYYYLTLNPDGHWDSYYPKGHSIITQSTKPPFSCITPDGLWHDLLEYGYKPILDFKIKRIHPDNKIPLEKWHSFWELCKKEHTGRAFCIFNIHS